MGERRFVLLGLTFSRGPGAGAHLGRGVSHVDLAKDGVAIVRQHDTWVDGGRVWDERGRRSALPFGSRDLVKVLGAIRGGVPTAGAGLEREGADRGGSAPPEASRIILSMERGPSVVRMISATACGGAQRRGRGVQSRVFARRPSVARGMWRLAPNARGGFDRRSGSWGWGIRDATHLSGGDVVQLRGATGLTLRVGVWMGRRGAIGQSMDSRGGRGKP